MSTAISWTQETWNPTNAVGQSGAGPVGGGEGTRTTMVSLWPPDGWRPVPGFPGYFASPEGAILSTLRRTPHAMQPMRTRSGHLYIIARRGGVGAKLWVHHAVLTAFGFERQAGKECRHLDGNPANNALANLTWGTRQENADDKMAHGRQPRGEQMRTHVLTEQQVLEIRTLHGTASLRTLGRRFGVSHTAIRRAALGIKWAHLWRGSDGN